MNQEPNLWTVIPQTTSALFASLSVLLALHVILRDRRAKERAEASKVICWQEIQYNYLVKPDGSCKVTTPSAQIKVHNKSEYPIIRPSVVSRAMTEREARLHASPKDGRLFPEGEFRAFSFSESVLMAPSGDIIFMSLDSDSHAYLDLILLGKDKLFPVDFMRYWVKYIDHAGVCWLRDTYSAELVPYRSRKALRLIRGRRRWVRRERDFRLALGITYSWPTAILLRLFEVVFPPRVKAKKTAVVKAKLSQGEGPVSAVNAERQSEADSNSR
ncbi:hypothetical protein SAMN02982929_05307 [Saccharopolyspora kobensis]|uniref:Uncharacterized protein n=1 Tax=Saccharopolyspora kobensis TaxID=146035 RepID=A0A1H6DZH8_9PSEU|nr:hypothetical protein SAMN02982929_05307 [Saccharopolyspora kobensis]SFD93670.1 hypothetical protein SAMN05216506_107283 [Saccharopolyspora kobensis]